jgi:predicted Zn-dependent peptidase
VYLETPGQWAGFIGGNITLGRSLDSLGQINERIWSVTAQDIQRVAQRYLSSPALISAVGPSQHLPEATG